MAGPPNIHPFQLILQEHARFMMAIKDLQSQVQALQEFRSRVCLAFPHLDTGPLPPHPTGPSSKMTRSAGVHHHPGSTPGVISPKKSVVATSSGSKTGARVLPSVHQAVTPATGAGGGSIVRHVTAKTHQSSFGHDRDVPGSNASKGSPGSRGRGGGHHHHHQPVVEPAWSSNKKFIVVAQGKNWLRIRPCADKPDSESEDSDDEHNSTSDSLHSMAAERDKRKGRVGTVTTAAATTTAGRITKVEGGGSGVVGMRQDSGFSTDGKERLKGDHEAHSSTSSDVRWSSSSKVGSSTAAEDELMALLDAIGQKSLVLRRQADKLSAAPVNTAGHAESSGASGGGGGVTLSDIGLKPDDVLAEMERLQLEKEQILERLVSVESEKELYRGEMVQLRDVLLETETVRRALEERLEVVFTELERLGSRIHRLHSQFARGKGEGGGGDQRALTRFADEARLLSGTTRTAVVGSEPAPLTTPTSAQIVFNGSSSLPDRLGRSSKLKVRMDKAKISAILRETRSLELQRQLLVAVLRNEVLKTQLEHNLSEWQERTLSWQRAEQVLLVEADALRQSNCELRVKLQHTETDLKLERSKRQVLERALQAAYKDLTTNSSATSSTVSGGSRDSAAPTIASEHVRQLSVDALPIHQQSALNTSAVDKLSDMTSTSTIKSSASSTGSTVANTTITMASSLYTKEPFNYRRLRSNSHGQVETTTPASPHSPRPRDTTTSTTDHLATNPDDYDIAYNHHPSKSDVDAIPFVGRAAASPASANRQGAATVTFKTVQPSSGNVTVRIVSPNTFRQPPTHHTSNAQSPSRSERLPSSPAMATAAVDARLAKTSSYSSGLSPKNRNKIFISKCSQSAEDLRNSEWDWAYDINRSTAQHLNMAQHMVIAEAMT